MLTNEQIERLIEYGHWFREWNHEGNYENVETMRTREVLLADIIVRKFYWSEEIMELLKIVYGIDFSKKENNEKRE